MDKSFVKKIQNFSFHNELFSKGDGVLIGISGGPDSVCLTKVLLELKEKHNLRLVLLHVNYGLRGDDSDKDEEFVRDFAEKNKLPLVVVRYEGQKGSAVSEEVLRDFRYEQLEKERRKSKLDLIAVGHTMDDQVETFLMNVVRGTGPGGLGGMHPRRGKIIRPLLAKKKSEVIKHLERIKQKYRIDQSNVEEDFTRNKIRSSVIPLIVREFNPKFPESIFRLTSNIRRTNEVVDECAETTYNGVVKKEKNSLLVEAAKLERLSEGMQALVFRRIVQQLKGNLKKLEETHFFEFLKILKSKKSKIQKYEFLEILIEKKGSEIKFSTRKDKS